MSYKCLLILLLLIPCLLSGMWAETPTFPAPSVPADAAAPAEASVLPEAPHKFMDKTNVISFSVLGGLSALDAITTQKNLSLHATELNPLARPLVQKGWAGQMAATSIGYGAAIGSCYLFHKTGHHKMERFFLGLSLATESVAVINNQLE